jgi:hypothetical protein
VIEVRFHHCRELEPGGGLRTCLLELVDDWTPILPVDGWADLTVRSDDGRRVALVRWDGEPHPPSAFRVFVLDLDHRLVTRGPHVEGRCAGLWFSEDRALWWRTVEGALGHVADH